MRLVLSGVAAVVALGGVMSGGVGRARAEDRTAVVLQQGASAQATGGPEVIRVKAREVVVDVTVTDKDGKPVHGLQQSDFTVEENGKAQPIRSFEEFGPVPVAGAAVPKLPMGTFSNYQTAPASGPVNIFLLDAFHANFAQVYREREAIRKYLQGMPAGTECAIFWLSGNGLHLLAGFTADNNVLYHAIDTGNFEVGNGMSPWTQQWYTIEAFGQIAQYVSAVKGRKNLLWFAAGMPVMLTRDGGLGWHDEDMGRVHRLMDAYELLSAEQVAVYPVNIGGVGRLGRGQLAAEEVAEDSGGLALYGSNDLTGLIRKAIEHGSHFYTLSYVPPELKEDGRYHHIKIAVNRPGLQLVYRLGYNDEDPPEHTLPAGGALMKAAMEGDMTPATEMLFKAQVLEDTRDTGVAANGKDVVQYEIVYEIPQSEIAFTDEADGGRVASLEFDAVAYDKNHKRVALVTQTMKLPLTAEEYVEFVKTPYKFSQQVELPAGEVVLRAGVLDMVSKKVGTVEVPVLTLDRERRLAAVPKEEPPACPPRCAMVVPGSEK